MISAIKDNIWKLRKENILDEVFNTDFEVLNQLPVIEHKEYFIDDISKYRNEFLRSISGIYKIQYKNNMVIPNNYESILYFKLVESRNIIKTEIQIPSKLEPQSILKVEISMKILNNIIFKHMIKVLRAIKRININNMLKKNVKPLIPITNKFHKRHLSLSLASDNNGFIKPFSLYSIKKKSLNKSFELPQIYPNSKLYINTSLSIPTHENFSNLFTDYVI